MRLIKETHKTGASSHRVEYEDYHKERIDDLNKKVNTLPGKIICDLGSMKGYLNTERKVYKVDINKKFHPDVVADARDVPFKSKTFDIVVCSHLIEHVKNPLSIVMEAKRILKPGGILLLETPNIASFKNRIKILFGKRITWKWYDPKPLGHLHYREYLMSELRELIEQAGLVYNNSYGSISYRCKWKGMILERISSVLPKTWRSSIGIIGVKKKTEKQ